MGLTTGYNPLYVTGSIHPIADGSTAACAADLLNIYSYLNTLPYDIELLYPAQFGRNLVLTPHTYILNGATTFIDTLYLDARGNANGVFIIQINGAFSTSTYSKVILTNGTQAKNVFWKIDGAVSINDYSVFNGTIVCNNGAIDLTTGVTLTGRALTTSGTVMTTAINATMTPGCFATGIASLDDANDAVTIYPNPFNTTATIIINDQFQTENNRLTLYNDLGEVVMNVIITKQTTTLDTSNLRSGIYFFNVIGNDKIIQSGHIISQ